MKNESNPVSIFIVMMALFLIVFVIAITINDTSMSCDAVLELREAYVRHESDGDVVRLPSGTITVSTKGETCTKVLNTIKVLDR